MLKIVSWNINGRHSLWNSVTALKNELNVDVALLQEAPRPPEDLPVFVDIETPWTTAGSGKSWRAAVAALSEKVQLKTKNVKPIDQAARGEVPVSRPGTLAVGEITLPETNEVITLISMYSVWESPAAETGSSWIYADASAHRLISDISALIGRQSGHKIIAAGDLNILYGYGEGGSPYWAQRYETVFSRMEAIGLKFVGPQAPTGGLQANPRPLELPENSRNVPTFRNNKNLPETALRQLDFVFASNVLQNRINVRALNGENEWGASDHCRILIEVSK